MTNCDNPWTITTTMKMRREMTHCLCPRCLCLRRVISTSCSLMSASVSLLSLCLRVSSHPHPWSRCLATPGPGPRHSLFSEVLMIPAENLSVRIRSWMRTLLCGHNITIAQNVICQVKIVLIVKLIIIHPSCNYAVIFPT